MDQEAHASESINLRIARRVKSLRAERGLSLEGLATSCDVSRSMISLIERAETSPTAVVLEKVAAGLGVPLASLFADPKVPGRPVSRAADRVPWTDPETGYVRTNVSPADFPAPFQVVEIVLPAGARVAYEGSARDGSLHQQIWVQEGCLEVSAGSTVHSLQPGDCLAMQLKGPNTFRNPTRKRTRYVVIVATERSSRGPEAFL